MAAYAAVLSLKHTINQTQQYPRPPISVHQEHLHSLSETLTFLQDFLERYSREEEEKLEMRIAAVAYAAEDLIESHIVDRIHAGSTTHGQTSIGFYQDLDRVIQDMGLLKKEVMEFMNEKKMGAHHHHPKSVSSSGLKRPVFTMQNNNMVDRSDILNDVMHKLTRQQRSLEVVSIVGMGGIGKTMLAKNIYSHPLIVQHFHFLSWITISQEYSGREILLRVLFQENDGGESKDHELGERVYKQLCGRRYLIVMDDIWSIEAWDKVRPYFPNNDNGSRIMMTTRLSNLALQLSGSSYFEMRFLDENKSWDLLCNIVFGNEGCPVELENIGKEMARNCKGLPLSIIVTGGFLRKSKMTRKAWENTLENLTPLINLENNKHCLQILRMSYKELPIQLKHCFLYIGTFPEDSKISMSRLIKLWVSEGFLESIDDKSLEIVGERYLKELIDRNLLLLDARGLNGKVKYCKIHDLLRDLCLIEAQKQRFFSILRHQDVNIPQGINTERHICVHEIPDQSSPQILHALESASLVRSLLINGFHKPTPSPNLRLLRIYTRAYKNYRHITDSSSVEAIFQQANMRYLNLKFETPQLSQFPSWSLLWNLQTIKIVVISSRDTIVVPSEIWKMSRLRHAKLQGFLLQDPPYEEGVVLENLQTLSCTHNLKCSEEVVKRIPSIKKLTLTRQRLVDDGIHKFSLNSLGYLQKLEYLRLFFNSYAISNPEIFGSHFLQNITFPHSIKTLTLYGSLLHWEELTKIGSLPHLEVLNLRRDACIGPQWNTVDDQFFSLKFLRIDSCHDLRYWTTDSAHFPCLEHLLLRFLYKLEEVPSSIGDIPTLQLIHLQNCSKSATDSANGIMAEQEELGNVDLKLQIEG